VCVRVCVRVRVRSRCCDRPVPPPPSRRVVHVQVLEREGKHSEAAELKEHISMATAQRGAGRPPAPLRPFDASAITDEMRAHAAAAGWGGRRAHAGRGAASRSLSLSQTHGERRLDLDDPDVAFEMERLARETRGGTEADDGEVVETIAPPLSGRRIFERCVCVRTQRVCVRVCVRVCMCLCDCDVPGRGVSGALRSCRALEEVPPIALRQIITARVRCACVCLCVCACVLCACVRVGFVVVVVVVAVDHDGGGGCGGGGVCVRE
jgi:hypothetical protein